MEQIFKHNEYIKRKPHTQSHEPRARGEYNGKSGQVMDYLF